MPSEARPLEAQQLPPGSLLVHSLWAKPAALWRPTGQGPEPSCHQLARIGGLQPAAVRGAMLEAAPPAPGKVSDETAAPRRPDHSLVRDLGFCPLPKLR